MIIGLMDFANVNSLLCQAQMRNCLPTLSPEDRKRCSFWNTMFFFFFNMRQHIKSINLVAMCLYYKD